MENEFEVEFRFDGLLAKEGDLDGSDQEHSISAARRILGLHAHCFLTGQVPRAAVSQSKLYHVRHRGSYQACHVDMWAVVIIPTSLALGQIVGNAYSSEIKQGINTAARFLRDGLRAAVGSGSRELPRFREFQPVLESYSGNHDPIVDIEMEQQRERTRLREITSRVLFEDAARAIGRSADLLTIRVAGEIAITIDIDAKNRWLDKQITAAVNSIRNQNGLQFVT